MFKLILVSVCFFSHSLFAGEMWSVTESINTPESTYYEPTSDLIFASNISGSAGEKDGVGWISKISPDGKVESGKWVEGLDAPKGLTSFKNTLWVTNITEMVSIDIKAGKILSRVAIEGAKFLNDPAVSPDGTLYVSDTVANKIFQIKDGKTTTLAPNVDMEGPNGLQVVGDDLIVAAFGQVDDKFNTKVPGHLFKINLKTLKKTLVTKAPLGNLDGLELEADGNYLVSDYKAGKVFRVSKKGKAKELIAGFKNSADIGYIAKTKTLLVPEMSANKVSAFALAK